MKLLLKMEIVNKEENVNIIKPDNVHVAQRKSNR